MQAITCLTHAVPRQITRTRPVLRSIWLWRWIVLSATLDAQQWRRGADRLRLKVPKLAALMTAP